MATLTKNRRLNLDRVDNKKILEELQAENSSSINPDFRAFLNTCIKVSANVSKNKTQRVF